MRDFRHRFGAQLRAAARERAARRDFRARFGASLALAATALARERESALLAGDFRVRLGAQLSAAAADLAGARAASPARRRPWRPRAIPRLALFSRLSRPVAIGLSLTVLAGAATAASVWLPQLGNPAYHYNPGVNTSSPPSDEVAALAILSRPQTSADRSPLVQAALEYVNNFTTGVRTDYVHVLVSRANAGVVLVPVAHRDATGAGVPSAPGGPRTSAIDNALCVYAADSDNPATISIQRVFCWSLSQVLGGTAVGAVSSNETIGLAPDGVTTAIVHAGGAAVAGAVTNNFFDVSLPVTTQAPGPPTVTFVRSGG